MRASRPHPTACPPPAAIVGGRGSALGARALGVGWTGALLQACAGPRDTSAQGGQTGSDDQAPRCAVLSETPIEPTDSGEDALTEAAAATVGKVAATWSGTGPDASPLTLTFEPTALRATLVEAAWSDDAALPTWRGACRSAVFRAEATMSLTWQDATATGTVWVAEGEADGPLPFEGTLSSIPAFGAPPAADAGATLDGEATDSALQATLAWQSTTAGASTIGELSLSR